MSGVKHQHVCWAVDAVASWVADPGLSGIASDGRTRSSALVVAHCLWSGPPQIAVTVVGR